MRIFVLPAEYCVCRLAPGASLPDPGADAGVFHCVTRTLEETSLVCATADAPAGARVQSAFSLLQVVGPLAFEEVGILARLTTALARADVSVFAISTFDTDYLLVQQPRLPQACRALRAAGCQVASDSDDGPK